MDRFLNFIEKAGNKLPHPTILFFWLAGITLLVSWIVGRF
ncbi:MAG: AbgT family transporter, partial [Halanaerobiales bacterium]